MQYEKKNLGEIPRDNKNIFTDKSPLSDFEYELFSLPKKEVKVTEKYMIHDGLAVFDVFGKTIKHQCPKCGSYRTKRVGKGYEFHEVNHMFLSNYIVLRLNIAKRRFKCLDCEEKRKKGGGDDEGNSGGGYTFLERLSFVSPGLDNTNTFKNFVLREWEFQSIRELSRKFRISDSAIYRMIRDVNLNDLIEDRIKYLGNLSEIWIGIDEFSFSGRDYLCEITELKSKRLIGILRTNSKEELEKWLQKLPIEILEKIAGVGSDMNNTYKTTIENFVNTALKKAGKLHEKEMRSIGVVDHFHLKQLFLKLIMEVYNMNIWMIKAGHYDKIVRDLATLETKNFNKYRTDRLEFNVREWREYRPNDEEYRPITLGYFLSKRYINLLLLESSKLTNKQQHRLNQILMEFDPKGYLKDAYLSKELMNETIDGKDLSLLEKVIHDLKNSIHYKVQTAGATIEKWKQEILNFFKTGITNAFTEGKNTKAKLFKRMAYGYKIKDNYMKRLLLCL